MADYLIVKLAAKSSNEGKVVLSMKDPAFTAAINRLQACYQGAAAQIDKKTPEPFINIFGTAGHSNLGYRSIKYLSNGTADSVTQKIWAKVLTVHDEKPRAVSFREGYAAHLPGLMLKKDDDEPLPKLHDVAIWFYRSTDLDSLPATPGADDVEATLGEAFAQELGLTEAELAGLFEEKKPRPANVPSEATASSADTENQNA